MLTITIVILVAYFSANEIMYIWEIERENKIKANRKQRNQSFRK